MITSGNFIFQGFISFQLAHSRYVALDTLWKGGKMMRRTICLFLLSMLLWGMGLSPAMAVDFMFITLDAPVPNDTTQVFGINNAGQIVGTYHDPGDVAIHGFLSRAESFTGSFITLDAPDPNRPTMKSLHTEAWGINSAGQIVGEFDDANGIVHGFLSRAENFTGSFITLDAPGINLIPGTSVTTARRINSAGQIVGFFHDPDASAFLQGFLSRAENFTGSFTHKRALRSLAKITCPICHL
jgi:hypothetical protein